MDPVHIIPLTIPTRTQQLDEYQKEIDKFDDPSVARYPPFNRKTISAIFKRFNISAPTLKSAEGLANKILCLAVKRSAEDVVDKMIELAGKEILDYGAEHHPLRENFTPLAFALCSKNYQFAATLIKKGAGVNTTFKRLTYVDNKVIANAHYDVSPLKQAVRCLVFHLNKLEKLHKQLVSHEQLLKDYQEEITNSSVENSSLENQRQEVLRYNKKLRPIKQNQSNSEEQVEALNRCMDCIRHMTSLNAAPLPKYTTEENRILNAISFKLITDIALSGKNAII